MTRRRRRIKEQPGDLTDKSGYFTLREDPVEGTLWRTPWGRG